MTKKGQPRVSQINRVKAQSIIHPPWVNTQGGCLLMLAQTSTFPLSEGDILHHTKLVPEVYELCPGQRLGQNVCNLLICRDILELNHSLLYHISDEMIFDLNMLRPVM